MWNDLNANGIETANEPLMPGLTVRLMKDGVAEGSPATTGANGAYSFAFVRNSAAVYTVLFSKPTGYRFTDARQGTDYTIDSDADASGVSLPVTFPSPRNAFISAALVSAPTVEITYDIVNKKSVGLKFTKRKTRLTSLLLPPESKASMPQPAETSSTSTPIGLMFWCKSRPGGPLAPGTSLLTS